MSVASRSSQQGDFRSFYLAIVAGLACAFVIGKSLPTTIDAVSANASMTEPAELIAVFVADEGAQLTTLVK